MKKEIVTKIIRGNAVLRSVTPIVLRCLNPRYSYCKKCGLPWNWCKSKSVMTSEDSGTFATCDYCWEHSTLAELKQCYTKTYRMQERLLDETQCKMKHTLEHLLKCVEGEYNRTKTQTEL